MTPKIRPMNSRDKSAIMRILRSTPEFNPTEVAMAEEVVDSYVRDPLGAGYHVLVAEVAPSIVGYVCYGPTPMTDGTWDIYWLAVAPEEQGQGIGAALLSSAEAGIREAQGRLAIIETSSRPQYEKTRRFHRRQGYEVVGHIPDFYAPGDGKLIFRKKLNR